jgi:hypothetical protein
MIEHGTILMDDNEPAVKIATDRKTSAKIKHWKLRYHICREAYDMLRSCAHVCAGSGRHMAHASIGALLVHGPCDPLGLV